MGALTDAPVLHIQCLLSSFPSDVVGLGSRASCEDGMPNVASIYASV